MPKFSTMVKEVAAHTSSPLVVFIEGLDLLQEVHQGRNMDWLPNPIPDVSLQVPVKLLRPKTLLDFLL